MKEFTSLLLDINDMYEEGKLFNFLTELQPRAQVEVRKQRVKDLPIAMTYAKALVDYQDASTMDMEKEIP